MKTPDGQFLCDIRYDGCQTDAVQTFLCKVEGIEMAACRPCLTAWRSLAAADPALTPRCPRCAKIPTRPQLPRLEPVRPQAPLQGIIAMALDKAMFLEGVLTDTRARVLVRLAADEPWLGDSATEVVVGDQPEVA